MRAVLDQDIDLALACLMAVPAAERAGRVALWLEQSHMADKMRKRLGRRHGLWGDGTLAGRLWREPRAAPPRRHDAATLAVLAELTTALCDWREGQVARARKTMKSGEICGKALSAEDGGTGAACGPLQLAMRGIMR